MRKYAFGAAIATTLALAGCALAPAAIGTLSEALGPQARALLGPEVEQVVTMLQGRGAVALEAAFAAKFDGAQASDAEAARRTLGKAQARKRLLDRLRSGNDYSQFVAALDPAARATLEAARLATDRAYARMLGRLAETRGGSPAGETAALGAGDPHGLRRASEVHVAAADALGWEDAIGLCRAAILDGETAVVAARFARMSDDVRQAAPSSARPTARASATRAATCRPAPECRSDRSNGASKTPLRWNDGRL
ncbi:MAG: hypothetical protein QOG72_2472 [Sphingomonadales bacterium]|nr:hypothetical protein [Sphingomonadales bacterium]